MRRTQNWSAGSRPGNAAFVPPPPHVLGELLSAFEKSMHRGDDLPPLVRAGLLHSSSSASVSPPPVVLEKAGVLGETTGKKRDRSWVNQRYLDRLRVGTEL